MSTSWRKQSLACVLLTLLCAALLAFVPSLPDADDLSSASGFIAGALLMLLGLWQCVLLFRYYQTHWGGLNGAEVALLLLELGLFLLSLWCTARQTGGALIRFLQDDTVGQLHTALLLLLLRLIDRRRGTQKG